MRHTLSFESFVEWLGTKPPEGGYMWTNPGVCAVGQWLRSLGWPEHDISAKSCEIVKDDNFFGAAVLPDPYTFGNAYKRGKAILKSRAE